MGSAAAVGFAIVCGPTALEPGHALEGGVRPSAPCVLQVSEAYLPELAGTRRVAILSPAPNKFFVQWTYQDECRRTEGVIVDPDRMPAAGQFKEWADREECDAIVWLDIVRGSAFFEPPEVPGAKRVPKLLAEQTAFVQTWEREWPEYKCRVVVWRRRAAE